jgi:transposase-like protein
MIIDDDDFDDDYDEPTPAVTCPECGSDDLEVIGEDDDGENLYECNDCGETFTEDEEEEQ